jgi:hypothetical protein
MESYYSVINTPEIDNYFNDYGGVLAYFLFTSGVYQQLPEVYNGVPYSYTCNPGSLVLYAQSYTGTATTLVLKLVLIPSGN